MAQAAGGALQMRYIHLNEPFFRKFRDNGHRAGAQNQDAMAPDGAMILHHQEIRIANFELRIANSFHR
jgi:hypothetical protein